MLNLKKYNKLFYNFNKNKFFIHIYLIIIKINFFKIQNILTQFIISLLQNKKVK